MIALFALILDACLGEPRVLWSRIPHPIVLLGRLVGGLDTYLNTGTSRRAKGVLAVVVLLVVATVIGTLISTLGPIAEIAAGAILLAHRSLVQHVQDVGAALQIDLPAGRLAVAQIVGRDTDEMTEPQVIRAAIESGAENFSDGVIAPLFWLLIGGVPGILAYKAINTADSMIGYRTAKYAEFGWAAARLDDALNWLPARATAALILASHGRWPWGEVAADARLHRSPNAGWPEAALSRVLGIALAGPRSYEGQMQDFAWVNPVGEKDPNADAISKATLALWRTWVATLVVCFVLTLV